MSSQRILVVAPENDLLHSISFALEAENFYVTWHVSISANATPEQHDCTIVDHHALGGDAAAAKAFALAFAPVILLANDKHELSPFVFRTLVKPHLGPSLIQAIHEALAPPRLH